MTRLSRALARLILVVLAMGGAAVFGAAPAATFTKVEPATVCSIRMQGLVAPGDLAALQAALKDLPAGTDAALCMDSAGGSFNEALAIVKAMAKLDRGLRTIIDKGAGCYSACALIFMAGHRAAPGREPDRWVHPLGKLGFHAPYIKPAAGTYDAAVLARAHREALRAVEHFLELGIGNIYPDDLVIAMLVHGPGNFLDLETLSQARRWKIGLFDFAPPLPLSAAKLEQACINDYGFTDQWDKDSDRPVRASRKPLRPPRSQIQSFENYGDEGSFTCHVALLWNKTTVAIDVTFDETATTSQADFDKFEDKLDAAKDAWSATNTPLWHVLPPATRLVDIAKTK